MFIFMSITFCVMTLNTMAMKLPTLLLWKFYCLDLNTGNVCFWQMKEYLFFIETDIKSYVILNHFLRTMSNIFDNTLLCMVYPGDKNILEILKQLFRVSKKYFNTIFLILLIRVCQELITWKSAVQTPHLFLYHHLLTITKT